jgi:hypothetical protein
LEAQQVIALRLAKLAGGGNSAVVEATRMTSEKLSALWEAQTVAAIAALTGKSGLIPSRTLALYRRKMRANRCRARPLITRDSSDQAAMTSLPKPAAEIPAEIRARLARATIYLSGSVGQRLAG